jgi:hypothetical protein
MAVRRAGVSAAARASPPMLPIRRPMPRSTCNSLGVNFIAGQSSISCLTLQVAVCIVRPVKMIIHCREQACENVWVLHHDDREPLGEWTCPECEDRLEQQMVEELERRESEQRVPKTVQG